LYRTNTVLYKIKKPTNAEFIGF